MSSRSAVDRPVVQRHVPRGHILLEVVVALLLLGTTGIVLLSAVAHSRHVAVRALEREEQVQASVHLMDAATLWTRQELDLRLGVHPQGPWMLDIERVGADIYRIALYETSALDATFVTFVSREAATP